MELPFFSVKNKDLQILLNVSFHNNYPQPIPKKMDKKTKEFLKKFLEMSQISHLAVTIMIFQSSKI